MKPRGCAVHLWQSVACISHTRTHTHIHTYIQTHIPTYIHPHTYIVQTNFCSSAFMIIPRVQFPDIKWRMKVNDFDATDGAEASAALGDKRRSDIARAAFASGDIELSTLAHQIPVERHQKYDTRVFDSQSGVVRTQRPSCSAGLTELSPPLLW